MQRLIEERPKIAMNVIEHLAALLQELQHRVRELATERVEQRVARALLRLAHRGAERGVRKGAGEEPREEPSDGPPEGSRQQAPPPIHLTRQELGELTGATLYTVSRILSRWKSEGLIASGRERIALLKPGELARIADDLL